MFVCCLFVCFKLFVCLFTVSAVLEHEAIAGLSAGKPTGMRGRSSTSTSHQDDNRYKDYSLDSLMKAVSITIELTPLKLVEFDKILLIIP